MISSAARPPGQREAYAWLWLPGQAAPVVCGKVAAGEGGPEAPHHFLYGRSYLAREDALPLLPHDLPLRPGDQPSRLGLHGVLRDASPDAWGRRVLIHRLRMSVERGERELTEIDHLLARGNGLGALHFQDTPDAWRPPASASASLEQLMAAADAVEAGAPLPPELDLALLHGTSVGGARPKALLQEPAGGRRRLAKFGSSTDLFPMVRLEHLGLLLAQRVGIDTVAHERRAVLGRDVLLVDCFDAPLPGSGRRHFFSALTALDLHEMEARYASYPDLADYLRRFARDPTAQCRELYRRMLFNILIGNTDDHARNHALFWDGQEVSLTPAYDICPLPRTGFEASQAMARVGRDSGKMCQIVI